MTDRPRRRHPLLGAFPLAVMALGTFLVVFALLMARLTATVAVTNTPTRQSATAAGGKAITVRTRASAAGGATVAQGASAAPAASSAPTLTTRASGGSSGGFRDD